jgi:hypothetical protein
MSMSNYNLQKRIRKSKKSVMVAYLAWLTLGWHYLYLRRVGFQFAFWFTGGFLIIGYLLDFFRIPGMVKEYNTDEELRIRSLYAGVEK